LNTSLRRIRALVRKELTQLWRDPRTLVLILSLPIILLFLFAYAVSLTVDHLPTAFLDQSQDERSRAFLRDLQQSGYFDLDLPSASRADLFQAIDSGQARAAVFIPPNFAEDIANGRGNVLILLDGSDSFSVQSGYNAASLIAQHYSFSLTAQRMAASGKAASDESAMPIVTVSRVLYNPDMNDLIFILPGLVAMLVQNIIVAHASMAVVRERELGTMEQLLATPARPGELILAKLVPGTLLAFFDMAVVLGLGVFWFKIPLMGSVPLFFGLSFIFIIAYMGLGLLISTLARTQRQAQQISVLLLLFGILLTGFIFPRTSMPDWTDAIGNLIPLTYFVRISRAIINKGLSFDFLWQDTLILFIYAVVTITLASLFFKKRLD
jgi:ABC-2 type transport system permease protein